MPLSHIGLPVPRSKFDETVSFYLSALAPLGYKEHARPAPHVVGLGVTYPDLWISTACESGAGMREGDGEAGKKKGRGEVVHVAFTAGSMWSFSFCFASCINRRSVYPSMMHLGYTTTSLVLKAEC